MGAVPSGAEAAQEQPLAEVAPLGPLVAEREQRLDAGRRASTPATRSMIGFAGRPGTAVEPMCSIEPAPTAGRIRSASAANASFQAGS